MRLVYWTRPLLIAGLVNMWIPSCMALSSLSQEKVVEEDTVENINAGRVSNLTSNFRNQIRNLPITSSGITHWTQLGGDLEGEFDTDYFGSGMDLSGDGQRLVAGAPLHNDGNDDYYTPGHVKIFNYNQKQNTWVEIGEIGGEYYEEIGVKVSISHNGMRVAFGGWRGTFYVYEDSGQDGSRWNQVGSEISGTKGKITMSNDGMRLAVVDAALLKVRVYEERSSEWVQVGDDMDFGKLCSLSGNGKRIISGGWYSARVYEEREGTWIRIGEDIEGYGGDGDLTISKDGKRVAVSNSKMDSEGYAIVYDDVNGDWTQVFKTGGEVSSGYSLSLSNDGHRFAMSVPSSDDTATDAGQVKVYEDMDDGTWSLIAEIGGEEIFDESGESISFSDHGFRLAIAASKNNKNAGHVRVFASPTCHDSPLKFVYNKKHIRNCNWVADNPSQRCNGWKVQTHCPSTCQRCKKLACFDSKASFILGNAERSCEWINNFDQEIIEKKCRNQRKIRKTCRATCGYC